MDASSRANYLPMHPPLLFMGSIPEDEPGFDPPSYSSGIRGIDLMDEKEPLQAMVRRIDSQKNTIAELKRENARLREENNVFRDMECLILRADKMKNVGKREQVYDDIARTYFKHQQPAKAIHFLNKIDPNSDTLRGNILRNGLINTIFEELPNNGEVTEFLTLARLIKDPKTCAEVHDIGVLKLLKAARPEEALQCVKENPYPEKSLRSYKDIALWYAEYNQSDAALRTISDAPKEKRFYMRIELSRYYIGTGETKLARVVAEKVKRFTAGRRQLFAAIEKKEQEMKKQT